ncbi:MAG TPA: FHA domain-containing protein [Verrucomicrobiae bacterium]|nr:FHA domain-containing protein [Verrucomicrobiae bacterium]
MHQVLIKLEGPPARTFTLVSGVNRIGRNPANDICLDDPTVSGHHCEIVVLNEEVFVRDLGSTNGTFIDSRRVSEAALRVGERLHVGSVGMALENPARVAIPPLPVHPEANPVLPDGFAACVNHPASHATMKCTQCEKAFCELCVHQVRRLGGAALRLCPSCSGHCQPILAETPGKKRKSKRGSWISKITAKMTGRFARINRS